MEVDERCFAADLNRLFRLRHFEREIDGLLLAQTRGYILILLALEAFRLHSNRVGAGF